MKTIIRTVACLALTWPPLSAHAIPILSVDPSATETSAGSQIDVAVSISGLSGEIVGDYDVTLGFDDTILDVVDVTFGPFLDGPDDSVQGFMARPGSVDVFEVSLGLLLGQDGFTSFSLFTATFDVAAAGVSSLELHVTAVGDFFGAPLEVGTQSAEITSVPEPGIAALFGAGLLLLASSRRRV